MESAAAADWGFDGVHLAITDHDEFAGSLALLRGRPDLNGRIAVERGAVPVVPGALISPWTERAARERNRGNAHSNSSGRAGWTLRRIV